MLIRGGGSRADLAVFDSRAVAEAITTFPVPVLTGLGHEIDRSIADLAAHSAFKTPTKVAEFLVERVAAAERSLADLGGSLSRVSLERLRDGREMLGRSERGLVTARHRLTAARLEVDHLARRLPPAARRCLQVHHSRVGEMRRRLALAAPRPIKRVAEIPLRIMERLVARSRQRLGELAERLAGWERLCIQLAPERTLERGFSITRDSRGRALTGPDQVAAGERIISQLAAGRLASRVEES